MCKSHFCLAFLVVLMSAMVSIAQTTPVLMPAQFQISDCSTPFQANVAGATYTVIQTLGLTSGDCINVTAPGITINLNGNSIAGSECTCNGIVISKSAPGTHIVGGGGTIGGRTISIGIHDLGDYAVIENLTVVGADAGIFLDTAHGSLVNAVTVMNTFSGVAIQLLDTDHCIVENSSANNNGTERGAVAAGLVVGDSGSQSLSKNNVIVGNQVNDNAPYGINVGGTGNIIVSNIASNNDGFNGGGYGIYLGNSRFIPRAGNNNLVVSNTATGNQAGDTFDSNTNCGKDRWIWNQFGTRNQACIH